MSLSSETRLEEPHAAAEQGHEEPRRAWDIKLEILPRECQPQKLGPLRIAVP